MKRAVSALAFVLFLLLGLAVPAAAGGESDPTIGGDERMAAAAGPCGSSYRHIGHYPIGSSPVLGYMDVYWSSTAKRNCMVVNHATATYGTKLYTEASIWPHGSSPPSCPKSVGCDGGMYSYYAGPVYTPAGVNMSNRCLNIKGVVDWTTATRTRIHCG
ncbi:hypothetical protein [Jiangella endophytica]|uniref:hypothetical protein n=1 Tax=Jiangella endophytica TaxID=1623398 RepID=UPI0018E53327|nr:hypothetical protein [Jiangella endophytica]